MDAVRTIQVTGKGSIKVAPDMTRITMTVEGVCPDYAEALRLTADKTEKIKTCLWPQGFTAADFKTRHFNVETRYESYTDNGAYRQRFIGYGYTHELIVEFPSDNERLGGILSALARSSAKPGFRFGFFVKDAEKVKNELLGKAVTDSAEKARSLTEAAGVTLGDIVKIDYSWGRVDVDFGYKDYDVQYGDGEIPECHLELTPENVEMSDTVTVVWEIK